MGDWTKWWAEQSLFSRVFPAVFFLIYWAALFALGSLHADHVQVGLIALALAYGGRTPRSILLFLLPLLITVIIYDSMRFYADYFRGPIHVSEPYLFDKRFFGIRTADGVLTPNEFWQKHLNPALDLITGFAYLVFVGVFIAYDRLFSLFLRT